MFSEEGKKLVKIVNEVENRSTNVEVGFSCGWGWGSGFDNFGAVKQLILTDLIWNTNFLFLCFFLVRFTVPSDQMCLTLFV